MTRGVPFVTVNVNKVCIPWKERSEKMPDLTQFILNLSVRLPAILAALTFHEYAHGWVADKRGDIPPRDCQVASPGTPSPTSIRSEPWP